MQNSNQTNNSGIGDKVYEIDILKLIKAVLNHLWIIFLCGVIMGAASFGYTYALVTPTYEASAKLYVNNTSVSLGSSSFNISTSSLSAAQELVNTYIVILQTRSTLNQIIDYSGVQNLSTSALSKMISAEQVNSTEIFEITVTSTDPVLSEKLANAIAKVLPDRIAEIVDGSSVRVVDYAIIPSARSSPDYTKNTLIGIMFGIMASAAVVVLLDIFDTSIREESYLTQAYNYPVLAVIPDINDSKQNSHYYRNYYKKKD